MTRSPDAVLHARCGRREWLAAAAAAMVAPQPLRAAAIVERVPVLVYHRFAPEVADSMTVRLQTFAAHIQVLRDLGCHPVGVDQLLAWHRGEAALPPRAVVLTADDGHRSQFEQMAPQLRPFGWPMTLFVYPSAISNASYAMTWSQLAALQAEGVRIGSHTYWHPHFPRERQRLAPETFRRFAADQLQRSRALLEQKLGGCVNLLAWPFGLVDDVALALAREAGYRAGFVLGNRPVRPGDHVFALPRHLVTEGLSPAQLRRLLRSAWD